jgi:hypothetical protein
MILQWLVIKVQVFIFIMMLVHIVTPLQKMGSRIGYYQAQMNGCLLQLVDQSIFYQEIQYGLCFGGVIWIKDLILGEYGVIHSVMFFGQEQLHLAHLRVHIIIVLNTLDVFDNSSKLILRNADCYIYAR